MYLSRQANLALIQIGKYCAYTRVVCNSLGMVSDRVIDAPPFLENLPNDGMSYSLLFSLMLQ